MPRAWRRPGSLIAYAAFELVAFGALTGMLGIPVAFGAWGLLLGFGLVLTIRHRRKIS